MPTKKIPVKLTINVDVDGWNAEYGKDETPAEIAQSILWSVNDLVKIAFVHLDCVEVTA